jgi:hypothetical protein
MGVSTVHSERDCVNVEINIDLPPGDGNALQTNSLICCHTSWVAPITLGQDELNVPLPHAIRTPLSSPASQFL